MGKLEYGCKILQPCLAEAEPLNGVLARVPTTVNDCGRAIMGGNQAERLPVSGMPSLKRLIVRTRAERG